MVVTWWRVAFCAVWVGIRHEVLGVSDILETAVNEVICLVEGKEMAGKVYNLQGIQLFNILVLNLKS